MRLIVFGCSFTSYAWPTWSDIIAEDLGCDYENWGLQGIGNTAIAKRAMFRNFLGFNQGDIVIVQWSWYSREDRFIKGSWVANGSVFNNYGIYGDEFVKKYWDWDNDLINFGHARLSTESILSEKLKFQFNVAEINRQVTGLTETPIQKFLHQHQKSLPLFNSSPCFDGLHTSDGHPDPLQWLDWVEKGIYPSLGLKMKESTKNKVKNYYNNIVLIINEVYNKKINNPTSVINSRADILSKEMGWRQNKIGLGHNFLMNSEILF